MGYFISALMTVALLAYAAGAQAEVRTSVRLGQSVLAGGKALPAGTYQLRITDERPNTASGQPNESQRWVEFSANGMVMARETAEVFAAGERPIGTSSASGSAQAVVQLLKGGEYLRIAVNSGGARFLVHLPTASQAGRLYPDPPSRIPGPDPIPQNPGPTETKPLNLP